jgi:hypothetical protein
MWVLCMWALCDIYIYIYVCVYVCVCVCVCVCVGGGMGVIQRVITIGTTAARNRYLLALAALSCGVFFVGFRIVHGGRRAACDLHKYTRNTVGKKVVRFGCILTLTHINTHIHVRSHKYIHTHTRTHVQNRMLDNVPKNANQSTWYAANDQRPCTCGVIQCPSFLLSSETSVRANANHRDTHTIVSDAVAKARAHRVYTHIHTHTHTHTLSLVQTHMYTRKHALFQACMHVKTGANKRTHTHVNMCTRVQPYTKTSIHTHTPTPTHTRATTHTHTHNLPTVTRSSVRMSLSCRA